jgi:hypothetical protein
MRRRGARLVATGLLAGAILAAPARAAAQDTAAAACDIPLAQTSRDSGAAQADDPEPRSVITTAGEEPAATPAATPLPPAPDPMEMLASELMTVSEALAACLSAGDVATTVQLAGERYLGQLFGSSVPMSAEDYAALTGGVAPLPTRIVGLDRVMLVEEGRATATVLHVVGNQLLQAEWTFDQVPRGERETGRSRWRIVAERQLPALIPRGAEAIEVEIGERSFTLDRATVNGPDVVLRGANEAAEDHELLVFRLAPGSTTADLLRAAGPALPAEVTWIGEMPVPAGQERDLVLVDLPPGVYTLVCLFTDAEGTPHLVQGMEAEFVVG